MRMINELVNWVRSVVSTFGGGGGCGPSFHEVPGFTLLLVP